MNYTKLRKALGFTKALAVVCVSALLVPLTAPLALAGPTEDVASKYYGILSLSDTKQGGTVAGTGNNTATSTTTVILNLSYTGTAASANITIASGGSGSGNNCIQFFAPEGTADTSIGSATCGLTGGAFDLGASSVATLGQLCDLINGIQGPFSLSGNANGGAPTGGNYHCTLVGGVRSDSSSNYLPVVSEAVNVNNLNAVGGYQVPTSTSALISMGIIPAGGRHVLLNWCEVSSAGTPPLQVFGVKIKDGVGAQGTTQFGVTENDSALAWASAALAANTLTYEPTQSTSVFPVQAGWLEFSGGGVYSYALAVPPGHAPNPPVGNAYNGHVVVRVNNYGTGAAAQASTNFLTCQWDERSN